MESKFILTFINFFVIAVLVVSAYILSKKSDKLTRKGAKFFIWKAVIVFGYLIIGYSYLLSDYSRPEYFWYGTCLLYPITVFMIILLALYLIIKSCESVGYDKTLSEMFDEEESK